MRRNRREVANWDFSIRIASKKMRRIVVTVRLVFFMGWVPEGKIPNPSPNTIM